MAEQDLKPGETRRVTPERKRGPLLDFLAAVAVGYDIGQRLGASLAGKPAPGAPPRIAEPGAPCPTTGIAAPQCPCSIHGRSVR